ncbi:MAG: histidine--tRNA ligase [Thermoproteota archaeon]|nr:histidine--tRNA ligase [Thermoproteota archaeon]
MKLELPRGMRDIEPEELYNINYIKEKFTETTHLFNFNLMEPSPLETLATLEAKAGPSISNEIYSFVDKGNRNIALRFDLTIGLTRFVATRRDLKMPVKLASFSDVWRYDEPQAGRYRYFHQWDIEIYGSSSKESDVEVIEFVSLFLKKLGLKVMVEVNDRQLIEEYIRQKLGVTEDQEIADMLRAVDKVAKKSVSELYKEYKDKISLSKLEQLIDLSSVKGTVNEVYSKADLKGLENWSRVSALMDSLKSRSVDNVRVNLGVVRGLDYYSGVVFEAFDPFIQLGALVGGGRYDRLTHAFGRQDIGAIGAAGGVERIIIALKNKGILKSIPKQMVYVAYTSSTIRASALDIVSILRNSGINTDYSLNERVLRKQLDDAASKDAVLTLIVAPEEIEKGQVTVRSMSDGTESKQKVNDLGKSLYNILH